MVAGRPRKISKLQAVPCDDHDAQQGTWTRAQIERMDADFVAQMERAIRSGKERVGALVKDRASALDADADRIAGLVDHHASDRRLKSLRLEMLSEGFSGAAVADNANSEH